MIWEMGRAKENGSVHFLSPERCEMRLFLLGAPRRESLNRWKDYIAEDAEDLGWDVVHVPALGPTVDDVVSEVRKFKPDIFMWSRTHKHNPKGDLSSMLRRIEDLGVVTVSQHMDLYWGLQHRAPHIGKDAFWSAQYVFTADGGHQAEFAERGVNHFWMPPAIGSRVVENVIPRNDKFKRQVVFVGGYYSSAHGSHRRTLLSWGRAAFPGQFVHHRNMWGPNLGELYASCDFAIGDSAQSVNGYYWSDRIVNTLGRGCILAHPITKGLNACGFTNETMIKYHWYRFDEILVRWSSMSPVMIQNMREAGYEVVRKRHTYKNRLLQVQRVVGLE